VISGEINVLTGISQFANQSFGLPVNPTAYLVESKWTPVVKVTVNAEVAKTANGKQQPS
jgi:hypothetical protein